MKRKFFQEICDRLSKPWNSAFFGYFFLIVIVFAGFGVFYSFFNALHSPSGEAVIVAQNLATYFMAILAASVIDLNISWEIENRVSFLLYSVIILVVGILLLIWTYSMNSGFAFVPSILGCLLSWFIWIIANADNEKLSDENFYNKMRGKGNHGETWNN